MTRFSGANEVLGRAVPRHGNGAPLGDPQFLIEIVGSILPDGGEVYSAEVDAQQRRRQGGTEVGKQGGT